MKAYVLHAIGDLQYNDTSIPDCPEGWAIIKVKAAGICSSDIARIFQKGTYHFPTIPGHEFSGEVHQINNSSNCDSIGRRVGIFPLIPCHVCSQCQNRHYETCEKYDYLGSRRDGGFAEYVAVPLWNLIELPDSVSFTKAALLEPLSVALHAIKLGNIGNSSDVAIVGTGMIGISAGQWAKKYGAANVTVIGRNEAKRHIAESCNLRYENCSKKGNSKQYDFVLEAVGTTSAIEYAINIAKPGGVIVLMGNPTTNVNLPQDIYWKILRKQLVIKGTWNSFYDGKNTSDWTEALTLLANNEIDTDSLVSHILPQEQLRNGLELMNKHKEPYCKVMTIWNQ